ncbi:MAG: N-succinylarginine dihydrolase, partial [Planctomycetota bacterium]|nr:N-succinylarginine dihydrolase [Planctomycetota bacterium]
ARQSPEAIDAGVFHNDVIAVGNERVFLYHEQAFEDAAGVLGSLGNAFAALPGDETGTFLPLCVQQEELTLEDASACYLFNSQLLTLPGTGGDMLLLAPTDCRDHPRAERVLSRLVGESNPISRVEFIDVRQSMRNGGGPACLRLRVVLTEDELAHMHQGVLLTEALHDRLSAWVHEHYREELSVADLADPALGAEALAAGQALEDILQINVLSNAE